MINVKVIKQLEGGCHLLLVCPDAAGPNPPGDSGDKEQQTLDLVLNVLADAGITVKKEIPDLPTVKIRPAEPSVAEADEKKSHSNADAQVQANETIVPVVAPTSRAATAKVETRNLAHALPTLSQAKEIHRSKVEDFLHKPFEAWNWEDVPGHPTEIVSGGSAIVRDYQLADAIKTTRDVTTKLGKAGKVGNKASVKAEALSQLLAFEDYMYDKQDYLQAAVDYIPSIIEGTQRALSTAWDFLQKGNLQGLGEVAFTLTPYYSGLSLTAKALDSMGLVNYEDMMSKALPVTHTPSGTLYEYSYNFTTPEGKQVTKQEVLDYVREQEIPTIKIGDTEYSVQDFEESFKDHQQYVPSDQEMDQILRGTWQGVQ